MPNTFGKNDVGRSCPSISRLLPCAILLALLGCAVRSAYLAHLLLGP
ncbi:MAG: hypothetical protein LBP65_04095 [Puniceicoccales bacterium]|nr:hypothetical protein [Puniceicoccales bacterium]